MSQNSYGRVLASSTSLDGRISFRRTRNCTVCVLCIALQPRCGNALGSDMGGVMHGQSLMAIDPRTPTMPGRGGECTPLLLTLVIYLTVDHASLSRRSTVPAPDRDASKHLNAHRFFPKCFIKALRLCAPYPLSSRRLWPPPISPRIAIVFSLVFSVLNFHRFILAKNTGRCGTRTF